MKILISGGTGLIGKNLVERLVNQGNQVYILTRNKSGKKDSDFVKFFEWDAQSVDVLIPIMNQVNAVINLAGENIGSGFWTKAKKEKIISSRVSVGKALTSAILSAESKPEVFIQSSGVGYYGTSLNKTFDESSPNGNDWMAEVARVWEASSEELDAIGTRRVIIRSGVVLDNHSGALPLMVLPFKLFVGGPLGSGKQIISWIHLEDEVRAIEFILEKRNLEGAVNLVAPYPHTNAEFGKMIAKILRRPYWFPVPGFGLKLIIGEKSTLVLDGQFVVPNKLLENGFEFNYPTLEKALRDIL